MSGGWRFLNPGYVNERLSGLTQDDRLTLVDAFELLLEDPYDPPGLTVHPLRGRGALGVYIAHLPDDWYLTFTIHPDGLPPLS